MVSNIDIEDMTDAQDEAPERIWADRSPFGEHSWMDVEYDGGTLYIRADLARPSQAGDERVARMVEAARCVDLLPPGEWETWTSCSFRRITAKGGPDGGVLSALTHRSDGHPDLSWNERQCRALCDLVNGLRAALAALDTPKGGRDE